MTAEEMWKESGLTGEYETWSFGDDADALAGLVKDGIKTATCSARCYYEMEGDRSLEYWRNTHRRFFTDELRVDGLDFDEEMELVCEEFEVCK